MSNYVDGEGAEKRRREEEGVKGGRVRSSYGSRASKDSTEEVEAQDCCTTNARNKEVDGGSFPRDLKPSNVEEHPRGSPQGWACGRQGANSPHDEDKEGIEVARYDQVASGLLDGIAHLLENRELGRMDGEEGDAVWNSSPSDSEQVDWEEDDGAPGAHALLLERGDEGGDRRKAADGDGNEEGCVKNCEGFKSRKNKEALDSENCGAGVLGLSNSCGKHPCHNGPQGDPNGPRVRQSLQALGRSVEAVWHGYLPCAPYLEKTKCRRKKPPPGSERWDLHAPEIEVTTAVFPHEVNRWLTVNDFTKTLARHIDEKIPIETQINRATCDLEERFLEDLTRKNIVKEWGDIKSPPEKTLFMGNIFLHAEPDKERWRLIFHPYLFNKMVRLLKLQNVKLPRLREILKQIDEHSFTVKMDLKCAFFQIGIEPGLFCFRRAGRLYTLTRLPMGSSVSVLVAEALSLLFANKVLDRLKSTQMAEEGKACAFVDDIFVSWKQPGSSFAGTMVRNVLSAIHTVACDLNISLKFVHCCEHGHRTQGRALVSGSAHRVAGFDQSTNNSEPRGERKLSNSGYDIKIVDRLEVLGVDFNPETKSLSLNRKFQDTAKRELRVENVKTPRGLWRLIGTCFYAIYALGICPARFPRVFGLLSRVAATLAGANRFDPRWEEDFRLTTADVESLKFMVDTVLSFPMVVFQSRSEPGVYVFTDASNLGLGSVICFQNRVCVRARKWSPAENILTINSKEVIAAGFGVQGARSRFRDLLILLGVDNTAAFFDIINGYSKEPTANQTVLEIRTKGNLGLIWIPTELMPADGASRFVEDSRIWWKISTILNHTVRYAFLHRMV